MHAIRKALRRNFCKHVYTVYTLADVTCVWTRVSLIEKKYKLFRCSEITNAPHQFRKLCFKPKHSIFHHYLSSKTINDYIRPDVKPSLLSGLDRRAFASNPPRDVFWQVWYFSGLAQELLKSNNWGGLLERALESKYNQTRALTSESSDITADCYSLACAHSGNQETLTCAGTAGWRLFRNRRCLQPSLSASVRAKHTHFWIL